MRRFYQWHKERRALKTGDAWRKAGGAAIVRTGSFWFLKISFP